MQKNNNKMDEDLKKMLASVDIHDLKYITVNDLKWVTSMDSWQYLFMCLSHTGWFQHNLGEFYNRTRPTYQFAYCRLEFLDCLRMWRIVKSTIGIDLFWFQSDLYLKKWPFWVKMVDQSKGYCLELDPELVEKMGFDADELSTHPRKHFRTLEFTVG